MNDVRAPKHRHAMAVLRRILGRMVVFGVIELALFVAVPVVLLGWQPVVVMGNSMQPHLRPGDALLINEVTDIDTVPIGTVVTFRRVLDDKLVTHRVIDFTDDGQLVTKGDANDEADSDAVPAGRLVGAGRLVVPMVALPAERPSTFAPLLALGAILSLLALARSRHEGAGTAPAPEPHPRSAPSLPAPATPAAAATALPDLWVAGVHQRRWPWPAAVAVTLVAVGQTLGVPPTFVQASFATTTATAGSQWQADVIETPTGLTLTFTTLACVTSTMRLDWTKSVHGSVTSQQVFRSVDGGARSLVTTVGPSVTTYTQAAQCGRTYVYDVVAVAAFGATTWESTVTPGQNRASKTT